MARYDDTFFSYVNSGALRSARRILPMLLANLDIESVLDVGCGQGAWLSVWKELGVPLVAGIDGDYVDRSRLLCPREAFTAHDLAQPFDLRRRFDLVQCLEVAEHLPASSAAALVESLVRHGEVVLFSAAPKGQGGDHHVNEQSYDYWRDLFSKHDYVAIDFPRRKMVSMSDVEPWYRYNIMLYVAKSRMATLPPEFEAFLIADSHGIEDISPLPYKLRKMLVRMLPVPVMTQLAKLKERVVAGRRRARLPS